MSNQKIRHWIYVTVMLVLIGYGAWFLLLHDSGYSQETLSETYLAQKQSFDDVAEYLVDKGIRTEITGLLTAGNSYGVRAEDSNEYRAFVDGVERLMEKEGEMRIRSNGKSVVFILPAHGGLMAQEYAALGYCADALTLPGEAPAPLTGDWSYFITTSKP